MTDRINYLTVALTEDIRDDDCAPLVAAIQMMKGVLKVEPNVVNNMAWLAESRAKHELTQKIYDALK